MKPYIYAAAFALISSASFAATELNTAAAQKAETAAAVHYLSNEETEKHLEALTRLRNYLQTITTLTADFTQTAPDGSLSTGKFYLQRPGKMRWEYAPPTPVLIVSNGSELVYYDSELEQVSTVPLSSTLGGFLAEEEISFTGAVGVEEFSDKDSIVRITLSQREKPDEGKLTLEFSDKPLQLRNMITQDAAGNVTYVALSEIKIGNKLNRELFIFRDPRKKRR